MIYPTFGTWTAKLIPHLIEKSSILVEVAFIIKDFIKFLLMSGFGFYIFAIYYVKKNQRTY